MKILEVKNLNKTYHTLKKEIIALEDISFSVNKGDFISIVGPSGCGKSTILSILSGLLNKSSGEVNMNKNITMAYMLQDDCLLPFKTILENCLIGLEINNKLNDENKEYVINLLNTYGLGEFINSYPNNLSGGMRQRVALIRTLAIKPDILFLDEPFSALDYTTRLNVSNDVFQIIKSLNKTTIMVSHDITEAISMADRVVVLSKSPATIKNIYTINIKGNNLLERRKDENFNNYYESILKDMDYV